ncbi:MAG: hypothetical protein MJ112_06895, partial [Lachnospiraceae bacterium]|nr:hypothetical protein [Lachnospiraceae bacterium]
MGDNKKKVVVKGLAKAFLSTEPEVEEVAPKKAPKKREKKPAVPKASEVAASIRKKERELSDLSALIADEELDDKKFEELAEE